MTGSHGLTLNELMITVIIVSVLAGLAIPSYLRAVEKARGGEALGTLRLIRAAEKVYYFDSSSFYTDLTVAVQGNLVGQGYIQNPNGDLQRAFDYSVLSNNGANPRSFTATAKRISGCNKNETITLDNAGTQGGTWSFQCP